MVPVRSFRIAAMIVKDRDVISIGTCKMKTHPLQKRYQPNAEAIFLHAEIDAIAKALNKISREDLQKSTLYILRLKKPAKYAKNFVRAMAKPCKGCAAAIGAFKIKKVFYTEDE